MGIDREAKYRYGGMEGSSISQILAVAGDLRKPVEKMGEENVDVSP